MADGELPQGQDVIWGPYCESQRTCTVASGYRVILDGGSHLVIYSPSPPLIRRQFRWKGMCRNRLLRVVCSSCHSPIGIGVFVGRRLYRVLTWYGGLGDITVTAEVVQRQTAAFTKVRSRNVLLHASNLPCPFALTRRLHHLHILLHKKDPSPLFPSQCVICDRGN